MRKLSIAILAVYLVFASVMPGFCGFIVLDMDSGSAPTGCTNVAGALTCTSFTGDGTGLTGITATDDNNSKMTRLAEEAIAAAGLVDISGTPANHYWGIWTDANTQKGVAVTASKVACSNADGDPVACTNLTDTAFSGYAALSGATFTGTVTSPVSVTTGAVSVSPFSAAGAIHRAVAATITDNGTPGTRAVGSAYSFGVPTFASDGNAITVTDASTVYIAGPPLDGGDNMDLTNVWSLYLALGNTYIKGALYAGNGGFVVDDDGDVTAKSVTATKVANTAGTNTLYNDNGTQGIGFTWKGPHQTTAQTDDFVFQVPTGEPAEGQVMAAGTVASHATTATWVTPATLTGAETLTNKTLDGPIVTSKEEDCHADGNLTAAQLGNTIFTNYDQADGNATCILPTAARGMSALFTIATARAKTYGVRAKSTDKIYLLAADGTIAAGDDHGAVVMVNAQVGQQFACYTFKTGATAYDWACKAIAIGTSTFEARPAP